MSTDLIGRTIDDYCIESLLGQGGMGAVYRARDTGLDRSVALKVLHPQYAGEPSFQERFTQEARAIAQLDHPSIVKVYTFGVWSGLYYMVMEYVPGGNLATYLRLLQQQEQILRLDETLNLLAQVADALGYAHRRGIIHRDIKPDNILLKLLDTAERPGDPPLRAVVTDFGLVKLMAGGNVQTQAGAFMGTLAYMSPEQVLVKPVDARTDIYSLGVVLYQLATGELPLNITSATDAVMQHMQATPRPPRDVRPTLPASVAAVIEKALAQNPNERYQSAETFAQAIRQAGNILTPPEMAAFAPPDATVSLVSRVSTAAAAAGPATPPPTAEQPPTAELPTTPPLPERPLAPIEQPPTPVVEMPAIAPATPPLTQIQPAPDAAPIAATPADQRVDLFLTPPRLEVMPGATGNGYIELEYQGTIAETLSLQLTGLADGWYSLGQAEVTLAPGARARVPFALHPPTEGSAAGAQRFRVLAVGVAAGRELGSSGGWLHVGTLARFSAELTPPAIRPGQAAQVRVQNTGNTPLAISLDGQEPSGQLTFAAPGAPTPLPPGQTQAIPLPVSVAQRPWLGRTTHLPFDVVVQAAGQPPQRLTGDFAVRPRLSVVWLALAALLLLAACGATLALALPRLLGNRAADETSTPIASAGTIVVPTDAATATATEQIATVTPTNPPPPPEPLVSADVTAARLAAPPTIDGNLAEWAGIQPYLSTYTVYTIGDWDGTDDLSGAWQLGWDDNNLYVALHVEDDIHVQTQTGNQIFRGDGVDIQIDTQRAADFGPGLNTDDFQITLSPGDFAGLPPSAWRFRGTEGGRILDAPGHSIQVAARLTSAGYELEARIPWRDLATTPATGLTLGIALNLNDNDTPNTGRQEVMKSQTSTRTLTNPSSWGTLTLR